MKFSCISDAFRRAICLLFFFYFECKAGRIQSTFVFPCVLAKNILISGLNALQGEKSIKLLRLRNAADKNKVHNASHRQPLSGPCVYFYSISRDVITSLAFLWVNKCVLIAFVSSREKYFSFLRPKESTLNCLFSVSSSRAEAKIMINERCLERCSIRSKPDGERSS